MPSLGNLVVLARLYHVSTDYLLGKSDTKGDIDFDKLIDVSELDEEQIKAIQLIISCMVSSNNKQATIDSTSEINE